MESEITDTQNSLLINPKVVLLSWNKKSMFHQQFTKWLFDLSFVFIAKEDGIICVPALQQFGKESNWLYIRSLLEMYNLVNSLKL